MSIAKELPEILKDAFPEWQPLLHDGLFFLRENFTRPVVYGFGMYRRVPHARDGIEYLRTTITEAEVREAKLPDELIALIVTKLKAAQPERDSDGVEES
jgi:hypothetical protein